jgi:DNA-binding SARP family transcriptional activator
MRQRLRMALRLYRGDYLHGHHADWLALERERLRCLYLDTLYGLANAEASANDWAAVVNAARRLCVAEPLREDAHRLLMEAYARTGNRGLALRQFRVCAEALQRELGVGPMPETVSLERRLSGHAADGQSFAPTKEALRLRKALVATRAPIGQALEIVDRALSLRNDF